MVGVMRGWNNSNMNGYPLSGLAPRPARRPVNPNKSPPQRKDRIELSAPVIYLPPAHPGVEARRSRPVASVKPGLETFSGRALLTAHCILKTPQEVLDEVRALSGSVTEAEMNRLFQDLDVERLILRTLNRRDPHNRLDAMDRRLLFVAETAGRGRFWLEHQLDWRGFGESKAEREALLRKVHDRLVEEHRLYTYALHALDRHVELTGLNRREALLALAAATNEGRALLEPNGHPLDAAQGVAAFLASVHREKGLLGLVAEGDLDSILRYAGHEAAAAEAARHDIVARIEENSRELDCVAETPADSRWWSRNPGLPKPPAPLLPVNRLWIVLRLVALLIIAWIGVGLWRIIASNGSEKMRGESPPQAADWYDLMPKDAGR